jgi:hypothetical protein
MRLGRWKTIAWAHYLLHRLPDVQSAARGIWEASSSCEVEVGGALLVGEVRPSSVCDREDVEVARSMAGGV